MIGTCIVVSGAMAIILTLFLKRLNKIEQARWGRKDEPATGKPLKTAKAK